MNNTTHIKKLPSQKEFLREFNISDDNFAKTEYTWETLTDIHNDYLHQIADLENCAILIFNTIMKFEGVHSVRYRVKEPKHLIEKIIRKKIQNPNENITIENYSTRFTDLIGVRALHLYKDRWKTIHDSILTVWDLFEPPKLYYRSGDTEELIGDFQKLPCDIHGEVRNCEAKVHPRGYRSIHYIIKSKPAKKTFYIEVQTRTIFEEAYSEIDHHVTYPYDTNNFVINQFLMILNRLAGNGDEMGTFLQILKATFSNMDVERKKEYEEQQQIITSLNKQIESLQLEKEAKQELRSNIDKLNSHALTGSLAFKEFSQNFIGIEYSASSLKDSFQDILAKNLKSLNNIDYKRIQPPSLPIILSESLGGIDLKTIKPVTIQVELPKPTVNLNSANQAVPAVLQSEVVPTVEPVSDKPSPKPRAKKKKDK